MPDSVIPPQTLLTEERLQSLIESCFAPGSDKPVKWRISHAIRQAVREAGEAAAVVCIKSQAGDGRAQARSDTARVIAAAIRSRLPGGE